MLLPCPEGPARAAAAFIGVAIATRLNREPGRGLQLQKRSQLFIRSAFRRRDYGQHWFAQ
jgi:hypothetical protein